MYTPNIVIEGGDKTGKSSLQKSILHNYPYSKHYFISDRSIMTRQIYSCINNTLDETGSWMQDLVNFLCNNAMILLYANDNEIVKRYNLTGDDEHKLCDIRKVNSAYREAIENELGSIKSIKPLDTSATSIEDLTNEAATWINKVINYNLEDKVANLFSLVLAFGDTVSGNHKELRNVRLAYCKSSAESPVSIPRNLYDESKRYIAKAKLDKATRARYEMDINNHESFYNYVFSSLFYTIESEIKFHGQDPLTSRRFHVVPPQGSCTSSVGVNFRRNLKNGIDMFCTVNIRSSDIVILPFDVDNMQRVFVDLIRPQSAYKLFGKGFTSKIQNFYFNYNFESVHVLDAESFRHDYHYMRTSKEERESR